MAGDREWEWQEAAATHCVLTGISKSYGKVRALDNLSFDVAEGRFFVLFGPSSVGKTTALRTIAGLVADRYRSP